MCPDEKLHLNISALRGSIEPKDEHRLAGSCGFALKHPATCS
jgi:hypothetical protein